MIAISSLQCDKCLRALDFYLFWAIAFFQSWSIREQIQIEHLDSRQVKQVDWICHILLYSCISNCISWKLSLSHTVPFSAFLKTSTTCSTTTCALKIEHMHDMLPSTFAWGKLAEKPVRNSQEDESSSPDSFEGNSWMSLLDKQQSASHQISHRSHHAAMVGISWRSCETCMRLTLNALENPIIACFDAL